MLASRNRRLPASGLLLATLLALGAAGHTRAADVSGIGDINLSPKRVILDSAGHAATVFVFNRGTSAATYSISLVDRIMTPQGQLVAVDDAQKKQSNAAEIAALKSAKDFTQFTPRRVTLQPGESQTIRIRALRPANLPAGEYRSHLTVTEVPPEDIGLTAQQAAQPGSKQLTMRVIPIVSLSIPVIVRQGAADARTSLASPQLRMEQARAPQTGTVAVVTGNLIRLGASSVYGNIEVRSGSEVVGAVRGIAVYPEISERPFQVELQRIPKHGENLSVVFIDDDTQPDTELAKVSLAAP